MNIEKLEGNDFKFHFFNELEKDTFTKSILFCASVAFHVTDQEEEYEKKLESIASFLSEIFDNQKDSDDSETDFIISSEKLVSLTSILSIEILACYNHIMELYQSLDKLIEETKKQDKKINPRRNNIIPS